jgi:TraK protein
MFRRFKCGVAIGVLGFVAALNVCAADMAYVAEIPVKPVEGSHGTALPSSSMVAEQSKVTELTTTPLPEVPVALTKKPQFEQPRLRTVNEGEGADQEPSKLKIVVEPGITNIVNVAKMFMNHFITPFDDPKVITVNPIEFKKDGSSIYVATQSDRPVGLEIRSNDSSDTRSISLTLIPKAIPQRTITLQLAGDMSAGAPISGMRAKRWEESSPYEETLIGLASTVAKGEVPEGYGLTSSTEQVPCQIPNVNYYTGQRLTGSHYSVFVMKAVNTGKATLELTGNAGCAFPGVVFVASYPVAHLEANQSTEVYVVVANDSYSPTPRANFRPSLLTR